MVKKEISEKLCKIFGVKKVDFSLPSESREQEAVFVSVTSNTGRVSDGVYRSKIIGTGTIYAQSSKVPIGFLTKRIARAEPDTAKNFYFYNIEDENQTYRDIIEMQFSFIYFYNEQYNPDSGIINEVDFNLETN